MGLGVLVGLPAWALGVGFWLDYSDPAVPSDYLVVLAGDFARPHAAAELYKQGLAPEVWICRPWKSWGHAESVRRGVPIPSEEDINRAILVKLGVPESAIHVYGDGVLSTYAEAKAFREAAQPAGKKVLVLTSRYHARRARMVFKRTLPDSELNVYGAADPWFTRRWWTRQSMAYAAVLETAKGLYWLLGGRFS